MKRIIIAVMLLVGVWTCLADGAVKKKQLSKRPVPDWFKKNTGLGLFMHWGPWSVKYWSTCGWSYKRGKLTADEYRKTLGGFNPQNYDPDKWMKAAEKAGFTYAVLTTRHHDGYELWPTKIENDWGTKGYMNGRDLLKPYVKACRKHNIRVGFYFSAADWFWNPKGWPYEGFPYLKRNTPINPTVVKKGDVSEEEARKNIQKYMDRMFYENIHPAIKELMTDYGKIDIMWFDGLFWPKCNIRPFELEKMIRSHNPDILINPRYSRDIGQYDTAEVGFPKERPEGIWELCVSIRGGWGGCRPGRKSSGRPTAVVLAYLAKCRSWGGTLLANIGPFPDGTMPDYFYNLCGELEGWMAHSREAIEGVEGGPWPQKSNVPVTTRDGGKTWYLFGWPQNDKLEFDASLVELQNDPTKYEHKPKARKLIVKDVKKPKQAILLRTKERVSFEHKDNTLTIVIPAVKTTKLVDVVKLEF